MSSKLIRKISAATLGFTVSKINKLLKESKDQKVMLYELVGKVSGSSSGQGTYGPWVALDGEFKAFTKEDVQGVTAPKCFPPEPFCGMAANAVKGENVGSIEFAIEVWAKEADNSVGYEFYTETIVQPKESDSLNQLVSKLKSQKALK